jgi:hypothetical protein
MTETKICIRLVGDVHGKRRSYLKLLEGADYSLQIGDMDISGYYWLDDASVDPHRHKFIGGNHDNYDLIQDSAHNLGDFGIWSVPNFGDIFYVRGAWSIDRKCRRFKIDWWPEEELTHRQCEQCLDLYEHAKPKMLVTHDCPTSIIDRFCNGEVARSWGYETSVIPTLTGSLLDEMRKSHKPKVHIFGHHHVQFDQVIDETRFICLPELATMDLTADFLTDL